MRKIIFSKMNSVSVYKIFCENIEKFYCAHFASTEINFKWFYKFYSLKMTANANSLRKKYNI